MRKVKIWNEDCTKVVAYTKYTNNLDHWDGRNWTCGNVGEHLGIRKSKKKGRYIIIHGTQWQGREDYAEYINEEKAKEILLTHNPKLYEDWFGDLPMDSE